MTEPRVDSICGFELSAEVARDGAGDELPYVIVTIERRHEGEDGDEDLIESIAEACVEDGHMDLYFPSEDPVHFCDVAEVRDFTAALAHCFCLGADLMRGEEGGEERKDARDVN